MPAYTGIYASPNTGGGQVGICVEANNTREAVALADLRRDALGGYRATYRLDGVKLDGKWINLRDGRECPRK